MEYIFGGHNDKLIMGESRLSLLEGEILRLEAMSIQNDIFCILSTPHMPTCLLLMYDFCCRRHQNHKQPTG